MHANLPSKVGGQTAGSFAAFVAGDHVAVVREAAQLSGFRDSRIIAGSVVEATRDLASRPTPNRLVVDLSGTDDPVAALASLAEVCDAGTQVIALGDVNDVHLYRSLLRTGVQEYLVKPVAAETMQAALRTGSRLSDPGETPAGKLIAVVGTRGGVGATTVATNLAWALANEQKMRVALVDIDLLFGSCALSLDLETGRGFREAIENPGRIDSLFIERAMVRDGERLYVLSSEEALDAPIGFDPAAFEPLLQHLRRDFQYVIIDFPRFALCRQTRVLTQPATCLLVSNGSLAGMRDTQRLNALLKTSVPEVSVSVCLNRAGAGKGGEVSRSAFEKGAEVTVDVRIPEDVKAFATSAATGKPVLKAASRSRSAAALRSLAARLAGARARSPSFPMLSRLLPRGR
jgi:pilus assembly protein CpaE